MTDAQEKRRMREFVVAEFNKEGYNVDPRGHAIENSADFYLFGERKEGALVLVYNPISGDTFRDLRRMVIDGKERNAFVFLKDGKNFFRSYAERAHMKRVLGTSLKDYPAEQTAKAIILSPAEIDILKLQTNRIQYYQPQSVRLSEEIVAYRFEPFTYDYSHIEGQTNAQGQPRFLPRDADSKRIFKNYPLETQRLLVNKVSR